MVKKLYLGVDIGTYETKGVLVDHEGNIYNQASIKHEMIVPKPGWAEHSPKDVWWGDFVKITKQLLKKKDIFPEQITTFLIFLSLFKVTKLFIFL